MSRHANNFHLIRLLAASQVLLYHSVLHLHIPVGAGSVDTLNRVPGVPVFFVISGFLITQSFERSSLRSYTVNRILRIYPALYVCLVVSLLSAMAFGALSPRTLATPEALVWLGAQLTIGQFKVPHFLLNWGTGAPNGVLWTITVELQFYIVLALIYPWLHRHRQRVLWLLPLFVAANVWRYTDAVVNDQRAIATLIRVTFVPYFYMFLLGVAGHLYWPEISRFMEGRALAWLALFLLASYGTSAMGLAATENAINPIAVLALAGLTLSAATTMTWLGPRLFGENDISYGLYIYHMPVVNVLVTLGIVGTLRAGALVVVFTAACAIISWVLIERPAMALKARFRPRGRGAADSAPLGAAVGDVSQPSA